MDLGKKLYKLRKEKGLSQEALAEKVGTTRQAISKWENGQGFPETEKLLQLSNALEVSIDFLLKDEKTRRDADERGFYVSREMAAGFLASERKLCRFLGAAYLSWALAGVPYTLFAEAPAWRCFGMAVCAAAGIVFLVLGMFSGEERYKILKEEPLLFDYEYRRELSNTYAVQKKKYTAVAIPCTVLFVIGILILALTASGYFPWSAYHSVVFLCFAIGLFGFVNAAGMMEAYELLVENERHTARLSFRLKRKLREKIDRA